jgi:adenosylcobinamide-phosphate synthase
MAAALMRYDWRSAFRIGLRDCKKHSSPNSGFGESAFAGALGVRLGGPTYYKEGRKDSPYIGDDINPLNAESISDANKIALVLSFFSWVIFSLLLIFYWRVLHV